MCVCVCVCVCCGVNQVAKVDESMWTKSHNCNKCSPTLSLTGAIMRLMNPLSVFVCVRVWGGGGGDANM